MLGIYPIDPYRAWHGPDFSYRAWYGQELISHSQHGDGIARNDFPFPFDFDHFPNTGTEETPGKTGCGDVWVVAFFFIVYVRMT